MTLLKGISSILIYYFIAVLVFVIHSSFYGSKLYLTFIDVGQGDAVHVRRGVGTNLLIDGGGSEQLNAYLNNYFLTPYCAFDVIFVTHPHEDHIQGLPSVLNRCYIGAVMFNDISYSSKIYLRFKQTLENNSHISEIVSEYFAGQKIHFDSITIYILWPAENFISNSGKKFKNVNDISGVLLLEYGDFEVLLTGDAEQPVLSQISWETYLPLIQGKLDVLKVPHHGALSSLNADFLKKLSPAVCVVSVGKNNKYGHPADTTLSLLKEYCDVVRRTDIEGTIELSSR